MLQNASMQQWNAGKVLADCLTLLADIDDLQTAVCILIVLGDRRNDIPIDESVHVSFDCEFVLKYLEINFVFFFFQTGILVIIIYRSIATPSILA